MVGSGPSHDSDRMENRHIESTLRSIGTRLSVAQLHGGSTTIPAMAEDAHGWVDVEATLVTYSLARAQLPPDMTAQAVGNAEREWGQVQFRVHVLGLGVPAGDTVSVRWVIIAGESSSLHGAMVRLRTGGPSIPRRGSSAERQGIPGPSVDPVSAASVVGVSVHVSASSPGRPCVPRATVSGHAAVEGAAFVEEDVGLGGNEIGYAVGTYSVGTSVTMRTQGLGIAVDVVKAWGAKMVTSSSTMKVATSFVSRFTLEARKRCGA